MSNTGRRVWDSKHARQAQPPACLATAPPAAAATWHVKVIPRSALCMPDCDRPVQFPHPSSHPVRARTHKRAGHALCQHILHQRPQVVHAPLPYHAVAVAAQGWWAGARTKMWTAAVCLVQSGHPARQLASKGLQHASGCMDPPTAQHPNMPSTPAHAGQSMPVARREALKGSSFRSLYWVTLTGFTAWRGVGRCMNADVQHVARQRQASAA